MRTLLYSIVLFAAAQVFGQAVPCESLEGAYRECRVGSSGTIRITFELSDNRCFEGATWGTRYPGVVWVTRGCRATFTTDDSFGRGPRGANRVVCESETGSYTVCPANTASGVTLSRQLGTKACVEEITWGYERQKNQIWVDDGCRAEFILGQAVPAAPQPALTGVVTCQSLDGKRLECKADTSAGVQIIRTFNQADCAFGRDWGYDRKGVWVTNGCRAAFAVHAAGKPQLATLICESNESARNACAADTHYGVALIRRFSEAVCKLDESWGFDRDSVWVSNGCRAQFALGGFRLPPDAVPASATHVICDSLDGKRNLCEADTAHGVGLIRQLGDTDCVLNRTWGYGPDGIWVAEGCNAEFAVAR